jgi:hypothetical protein
VRERREPDEPGPDVAERRGVLPSLGHGAIGDIAGVAHDVGIELVDGRDDLGRPADPIDGT